MNKFSREVSVEILVGLFMFVVLIALSVFTIVLSREKLWSESYQYEFIFTEVGGLREGDGVYLRGMNVGRVKQTALEDSRVHVYVTMDVPLQLRHGYKIEIVDASMLGGKYLKIYEGPEDAPLLGENVTILGSKPVDMIAELSEAVDGLQRMIKSVESGQGTLGQLLNDDTMYNNMAVLAEDLKGIVGRVAEGQGTVGKLLTDEAVYNDASAMMANLRMVSDRIAKGESTMGKLLSEDSELYENFDATMAAARAIAEGINQGEGTLGLLVRDAKLYNETTLLVEDVRAAVDDLREASPVTSFGSVLFGAF
ncbi:MlaD family protein [Pontiella agarivorans]|uniref:MlaD family protein n=1 Tax=Pontiella agarivorans TaxID=3038953 RepID=A0ABU5MZX6_9BACT|nr:MlaD family protein [Pontiella agarivorans]MDZ8119728.1 MlaD family protein [Pontiella agarivorans]